MLNRKKLPSQNRKTFLNKHLKELVSMAFFAVSRVTFRIRFVMVVLI
jgi:hypothetical protein